MTAELRIRWSEHEARKEYARPFGIGFRDGESDLGGIAVSGADLLYYRQFQAAVLHLGGELFSVEAVETAADPQAAWLDHLTGLLPAADGLELRPESVFDDRLGRFFRFRTAWADRPWAVFSAPALLEYQEFQAQVAHQTGRLYRNGAVEAVADDPARQHRWLAELSTIVRRPAPGDALAAEWPWRPRPA